MHNLVSTFSGIDIQLILPPWSVFINDKMARLLCCNWQKYLQQVVKKEVPKRLQFATRRVMFTPGNGLVNSSSYAMLEEVANMLKEYPDYNLSIGGDTYGTPLPVKYEMTASNANSTAGALNRRAELKLY